MSVNKDKIILKDDVQETLQEYLLNQRYENKSLFLAAENGSGQYENDVHIILNPGKNFQAHKWIVKEYTSVIFNNKKTL